MEDADSDSGFDSDGNRYHAGRDELYGLRTDSHAVGPTENRKGRHPDGGNASLLDIIYYKTLFTDAGCGEGR